MEESGSLAALTVMAIAIHSALSYALELLDMPNLTLKEEQRKPFEAVYQGNSVFVWLPTGFGKSICYQAL